MSDVQSRDDNEDERSSPGDDLDALLSRAKGAYEYFSQQTSDNARRLAFAGVAFIWVFSGASASNPTDVHVPSDLLWVGLAFVISLFCDFLQYAYLTGAWGVTGRRLFRGRTESIWNRIALPGVVFFVGKLTAVGVGYILLAIALAQRIH